MNKIVSSLLLMVFLLSVASVAFGQDEMAEKVKAYVGTLEKKLAVAKANKNKPRIATLESMIKEQNAKLKGLTTAKVQAPPPAPQISETRIAEMIEKALAKKAPSGGPAVSGTVYVRYLKGLTNSTVINNFDIDRAYLTIKNNLGDNAAYSLTLDSARTTGMMYTFLKYAYVDLKFTCPITGAPMAFRTGLQPTFWSPWVDGLFGLRVVASSMVGLDGGVTTSDFGFGQTAVYDAAGLKVNLLLTALNGSSYTAVENNAAKTVAGRIDSEVLPGVTVGLGGQVADVKSDGNYGSKLATGIVAYKNDAAKAYLELMYGAGKMGISAAGSYALGDLHETLKNCGVFGRIDIYDPNRSVDNNGLTRLWAGVTHDWNKSVKLIADYDSVSYDSAAAANAGKTVGQVALRTQIIL